MSNIIIPSEHQSAPKQTELDKTIRAAIHDIRTGDFQPELEENVYGKKEDDFFYTGITSILAQHPRVQDALRTLETQVQDKTSSEYLEKAEQLHEINAMISAGDQWEGQERWQGKDNRAMRLVNLLQPKEFIEKLQHAHISASIVPRVETEYKGDEYGVLRLCKVERSDAKICLGNRVVRGCVGLFANVKGEYKYINKLQVPLGPEWGIFRFDEYNVPTNEEHHGWRSAVLALITNGVLTEAEAHRAFGKPIENPASEFYRQQLAEYRNKV